jgi:hypothetical protein
VIDEISLEEYKKHPRILEIRFILLFDMFEKEFGYQRALKMYEAICSSFNGSMNLLMGLINKRFDIKRKAKTKYTKWRQEVIFASYVYGESLYKVAKDYLNVRPQNLYTNDSYDITKFVTHEWLTTLDDDIALCGMSHYRMEVIRFNEIIDSLSNVVLKWKGDK